MVILGHVQRGGSPSAQDAILATKMGIAAIDLVLKDEFGNMVAIKNGHIASVPLDEVARGHNKIDETLYRANLKLIG